MNNKKISASLEDYLEVIFNIYEEEDTVRAIEIAKRLSVGKSSVTEALRNLATKKLINYAPYEAITLTPEGIKLAKEIVQKHEILTFFLNDILKIEINEAKENACRLEHVISKNVYEQFLKFVKGYNQLPDDVKKNIIK